MKNPFDRATEISIEYPRTVLAVGFVATLLLSSMAMFLEFDNSEDAFFPDNETVRLLDEVESEYQASLDFVRVVVRTDAGLSESATWSHLGVIESLLLGNENLSSHSYPLFGGQPNNGPASAAISWMKYQSQDGNQEWIGSVSGGIESLANADDANYTAAKLELQSAIMTIPSPSHVTPQELESWDFTGVEVWLPKLLDGEDITTEISAIMAASQSLVSQNETRSAELEAFKGQITGLMAPLLGYQAVNLISAIEGSIPSDQEIPLDSEGPFLVSMAITTDPDDHDGMTFDEIQMEVVKWAQEVEEGISESSDSSSTVFSFSQFQQGQNSNLGAELAILNSASLLILGSVLYFTFRSFRDTAFVLGLTVFGILATYGTSGLLTKLGVDMTFNAAMNSIPVLLLAIGVDYGLHVVKRVREEYLEESGDSESMVTSLSEDARRRAIRSGTTLTSIALLIAIFTDIVGFLSFRLSSQQFLVVFGTVIAIGLFYVYLFSITALPALMTLIKPKDMVLGKSVKVERSPLIEKIGGLSDRPVVAVLVAIVLTTPMIMGIGQLEVGFDTRDNFDDSVPVVADFILISDEFQNSPAPIYVVVEGDVVSEEGRQAITDVIGVLGEDERVTVVISDLWSTLDVTRGSNSDLSSLMLSIESGDEGSWSALREWLTGTDAGRDVSSGLLSGDGQQTLISFQAATLDWSSTNSFESELSSELSTSVSGTGFSADLSGRSLILAQITSDVAEAAVLSTVVVAGIILLMLVTIHTFRTGNLGLGLARGVVTWIPLLAVVAWVYGIMGFTGFQLNSQTVTIGALTLGLGVDYAVHLSTRIEEEVEKNPNGLPSEWAAASISTTGRAMAGAAVTTAGGFSVLNLSSLVPLQLFGQAFVVAITLALLASVLLLPSIYTNLMKWEQKRIGSSI
mgnify:CR=1 FL=1